MPEFIFLLCEGETGRRYLRYLTAAGVVDLSRALIYLLPLSFGSKRPEPNFCWDVAAVTRCRPNSPHKCEHLQVWSQSNHTLIGFAQTSVCQRVFFFYLPKLAWM